MAKKRSFVPAVNIHLRAGSDKQALWNEYDVRLQVAMARQEARARRGEPASAEIDAEMDECRRMLAMLSV